MRGIYAKENVHKVNANEDGQRPIGLRLEPLQRRLLSLSTRAGRVRLDPE